MIIGGFAMTVVRVPSFVQWISLQVPRITLRSKSQQILLMIRARIAFENYNSQFVFTACRWNSSERFGWLPGRSWPVSSLRWRSWELCIIRRCIPKHLLVMKWMLFSVAAWARRFCAFKLNIIFAYLRSRCIQTKDVQQFSDRIRIRFLASWLETCSPSQDPLRE